LAYDDQAGILYIVNLDQSLNGGIEAPGKAPQSITGLDHIFKDILVRRRWFRSGRG
jgi:hypothetical protein